MKLIILVVLLLSFNSIAATTVEDAGFRKIIVNVGTENTLKDAFDSAVYHLDGVSSLKEANKLMDVRCNESPDEFNNAVIKRINPGVEQVDELNYLAYVKIYFTCR